MHILQIITSILALVFVLCGFAVIGMAIYLGRSKVKEIDRLVYGSEIDSDSIFFKIMRIPHYGGAFSWRFYARRSQLLEIRDGFNRRFQLPFMITFYLGWVGFFSMVAGIVLDEFFIGAT